jgi:5-methylthioribose kinase
MSFLLDDRDLASLASYLRERGWLGAEEEILSAEKPGEGNMNYTRRIRTGQRSFILKQARAYVEKYPSIAAPRERAVIESQFYGIVSADERLRSMMPALHGSDPDNSLLLLEDLGESSDYTFLYQPGGRMAEEELRALMGYASVLHGHFTAERVPFRIDNRAMRELNAEHIFRYPLMEENGFNLDAVTPGLQALAMSYKTDAALKRQVASLGERYLGPGEHLLHGDFYPGSWLRSAEGPKVIDPEFCFMGFAEFELGVSLAHLKMAQQPRSVVEAIREAYVPPARFDDTLYHQFAGVEIIRRLIGLAQLPLPLPLEEKERLLREARAWVVGD